MKITGDWFSNKDTQGVCRALTEAGHVALFVGGCVRNALLGVEVHDIDIATDAEPDEVLVLERAAGFKVIPTGIDHGTVTVVAGGEPHEITTFRHDVETDGRRAVIAFSKEIADDARRRDFTMNALYADASGQVIDPLGGLGDLNARRVRFIENPVERIREDYLRTLRFFRFHAWYGDAQAGLDAEGLAAIASHLEGLDRLSRERVGAEMKKLLRAPDPAPSVAAMRQTGVLAHILPGADDKGLAPLVHLEGEQGLAPDAMRRLAVLGGEDVALRFRLSKKETMRLTALRDGIGSMETPAALGYHYGADVARDVCLLRAAVLGGPVDRSGIAAGEKGENAVFPIKARDLMPTLKGPAIGKAMKALEADWIASGFEMSRDELLARIGD
ncbi:CCA tRNA nucleotidyltransferase [Alisedimentitalea sp. MJ-SS2]|uniref:CCA tRNA nucleotidyltransferase n=1 Tax=Aliisedimentitalea sp. MJ-SS2 TaxID=3049795 RepID=UPI002907B71F|nr:CCA tRNA nucleotidyltransferase [Alisedimentitalea sp. MJ-SS2]MDU8927894.1 CCA tRNA nucleotidyltransferase [Alisedimentitalea sp. MJ-SS2]